MNFNLIPFVVLWVVVAAIVLVLIIGGESIAGEEDDSLHVMDRRCRMIPHQRRSLRSWK